ncbi:sensor histidine kinase [Paraburkholderia acidisoli]|uniref:histidine kinase n=1 Tax=Paraburkholderia acidisoli TaxID=2571748 RepID=A0A7Z2JI93_9BURK|nr:HAMP domain-containing sensor histidine kinase [Paraburkholderia acidisoli]QGZ64958.1 two-component sensor histidine kinase [Paraburkholderia acidisoli]
MLVKARSLGTQLIVSLGLLVSLFALAQGVSSYRLALIGVNALLDDRLSNVAGRVRDVYEAAIPRDSTGSGNAEDLVVLVWTGHRDTPTRTTDNAVVFDRDTPAGFSDQRANGEAFRVYTLVAYNEVIQIAQRMSVRERAAEKSAVRALLPMLVLIPAVWVTVFLCVRRAFGVLDRLGRRVQAIDSTHLVPLPAEGLPVELEPFVSSINRMIERLDASLQLEHDFIADAAHELRTPLTALKLQADNLRGDIAPGNRERFHALHRGIERTSALVSQLLQLARADAHLAVAAPSDVDVTALVTSVVAELLPIATQRRIDIGAEELMAAHVRATEADLRAVVKNLVGNALRYTPEGGAVDLRVQAGAGTVRVEVRDTGPGIPEDLLPRVFDRFFRVSQSVEGSGLGLAIVRAIVLGYGGTVALRNRTDGQSGLIAEVSLPSA